MTHEIIKEKPETSQQFCQCVLCSDPQGLPTTSCLLPQKASARAGLGKDRAMSAKHSLAAVFLMWPVFAEILQSARLWSRGQGCQDISDTDSSLVLRHSLSHGVAYFEAVQEGTCSIEVQTQRLCELPWRDEEASLLETDEGLACLHLHPPSHCLPSLPATPLLLSH